MTASALPLGLASPAIANWAPLGFSGNPRRRLTGRRAIDECHAVAVFEVRAHRVARGHEAALAVGERERKRIAGAFLHEVGEHAARGTLLDVDPVAIVTNAADHLVGGERHIDATRVEARHDAGLDQHLRAVADPDDRRSLVRRLDHLVDHGVFRSDHPGANAILVRPSPRENDGRRIAHRRCGVVPAANLAFEPHCFNGAQAFVLAVHSRELNDENASGHDDYE